MDWKYIAVSIVGIACLFLFLACVWHDLISVTDLYLEEIIITPGSVQ